MLLLGNTFPASLIRARVTFTPLTLAAARSLAAQAAAAGELRSFWGHANTLAAAQAALGVSLTPSRERPALTLDARGLPGIDGAHTGTVLILSPDCRPVHRPAPGVEQTAADVLGWTPLLAKFQSIHP
jgi:hypothetical protein